MYLVSSMSYEGMMMTECTEFVFADCVGRSVKVSCGESAKLGVCPGDILV